MNLSSALRVSTPAFEYNDIDLPQQGVVMTNDNTTGTIKVTSTGTAQAQPKGRVHFRLGGITNGSVKNQTYYATGNFFTNAACNSKGNDTAYVVPFTFTEAPVKVKPRMSAQVAPALSLTIDNFINSCDTTSAPNSNYRFSGFGKNISFGRVVPGTPIFTGQAISFDSNARNGAVVYMRGTDLAGGRSISRMPGTPGSPIAFNGTEGYGFKTALFASNTWAGIPTDDFMFHSTSGPGESLSICVLYQVRVDGSTPFDTYSGTVSYTLVPRF